MIMEPVSSSAIQALGWEDNVMVVRYTNGTDYAFSGISFDTFEAIKESGSIGRAVQGCGVKGQRL